MSNGELPRPSPLGGRIPRTEGSIPYDIASGILETPEDIVKREEKIEQIRQGKY